MVKATLISLPADILLEIFDYLDCCPADQACLGLVSKRLYPFFHARHKTLSLYEKGGCGPWCQLLIEDGVIRHYVVDYTKSHTCSKPLHKLLKHWMPANLAFSTYINTDAKFIPRKKLIDLYRQMMNPMDPDERLRRRGKGWIARPHELERAKDGVFRKNMTPARVLPPRRCDWESLIILTPEERRMIARGLAPYLKFAEFMSVFGGERAKPRPWITAAAGRHDLAPEDVEDAMLLEDSE